MNTFEEPSRLRPAAIAGYLWLLIAGLLGLLTMYVIAAAPVLGVVYAVPLGLLGAFALALVTRRGLGLPLASMILGTILLVAALDAILQDPSESLGNAIAVAYCGAIVISSVVAVWSARSELPAMLDGIGRRAFIGLVVVCLYVGVVWLIAIVAGAGPTQ